MSQEKNDAPKAPEGTTAAGTQAEAPAAPKDAQPKDTRAKDAQPKEAQPKDWSDPWKKIAFAALGAVHVSPDEVTGFVKKLVEKGDIARKDGEKIVKGLAERVQKTVGRASAVEGKPAEATPAAAEGAAAAGDAAKAEAAGAQEKLAEKINLSIERVLHGMNIATRKDVLELGRQLDELDRKLGDLLGAAQASVEKRAARKSPAPAPGAAATA